MYVHRIPTPANPTTPHDDPTFAGRKVKLRRVASKSHGRNGVIPQTAKDPTMHLTVSPLSCWPSSVCGLPALLWPTIDIYAASDLAIYSGAYTLPNLSAGGATPPQADGSGLGQPPAPHALPTGILGPAASFQGRSRPPGRRTGASPRPKTG